MERFAQARCGERFVLAPICSLLVAESAPISFHILFYRHLTAVARIIGKGLTSTMLGWSPLTSNSAIANLLAF